MALRTIRVEGDPVLGKVCRGYGGDSKDSNTY